MTNFGAYPLRKLRSTALLMAEAPPVFYVGSYLWGPAMENPVRALGGGTARRLNDADNAVATIFCAPRSGTIDRVGVPVEAVVGNPPAYNFGVVTVDASGDPTATPYGGSALEAYDVTATGWVWVTLTTPATVVVGDMVAALITPGGTPPDGSNYIDVKCVGYVNSETTPRFKSYTTLWTGYFNIYSVAAAYDDDIAVLPSVITEGTVINSSTTPDELGGLFQIPFGCRCVGVHVGAQCSWTDADYIIKLYAADDTLLRSFNVDASKINVGFGGADGMVDLYWESIDLDPLVDYRLTIVPTTAGAFGNVTPYHATLGDSFSRGFWCDGLRWQGTKRTDGGAWTNVDTEIPMMALILDRVVM